MKLPTKALFIQLKKLCKTKCEFSREVNLYCIFLLTMHFYTRRDDVLSRPTRAGPTWSSPLHNKRRVVSDGILIII